MRATPRINILGYLSANINPGKYKVLMKVKVELSPCSFSYLPGNRIRHKAGVRVRATIRDADRDAI